MKLIRILTIYICQLLYSSIAKQFVKVNSESIPDMTGNIEMMVAEGDFVAVYAIFTGTQTGPMGPLPAYNKKMESKTMAIFRFELVSVFPRISLAGNFQSEVKTLTALCPPQSTFSPSSKSTEFKL